MLLAILILPLYYMISRESSSLPDFQRLYSCNEGAKVENQISNTLACFNNL